MPLDRIITIERPVIIRDTFGSEISAWATLDTVWAGKRETSGDERFVPAANVTVACIANPPSTLLLYWHSGPCLAPGEE